MADLTIIDGIGTLKDRFVPRFEVYVAKAPRGAPRRAPEGILDPETGTQSEINRLDGSLFKATGGASRPTRNQLVPLAGPWGEKQGQRTDDILSVTFKEDVSNRLLLSSVVIEVLNVYDTVRKYYRYTDIPPHLSSSQTGVFPLLDYGDALAVRFGYGSDLVWVFDGMITDLGVDFPAGGESRVTVTAVDRRDRLRNRKVTSIAAFNQMSEAQIVARLARDVGLRVAAPAELAFRPSSPPPAGTSGGGGGSAPAGNDAAIASASGGFSLNASSPFGGGSASGQASASVTQSGASASSSVSVSSNINSSGAPRGQAVPHNQFKPSDQDALAYITDRLKRASLELRCFGNTLFILKPADVATTALRYVYRQGLSSFSPKFEGTGKATQVLVKIRNSVVNKVFDCPATSQTLRAQGLISSNVASVLEKIAASGGAGDRVELVSDNPYPTEAEGLRAAAGMLKRNADETLTASGQVIGDPRIRARTTLKIEGVGRFDGLYYVTSATHTLNTSGYQTSFNVRRTSALAEEGAAELSELISSALGSEIGRLLGGEIGRALGDSRLIEGLGSIVKVKVI
jgi:hypothetical protein